ncbi:PIN-like domain-containing protein [Acinetobacter guillouiae]|uniref:PIN-like domain-containing protein n=1 Tax=Acinetobacter guillouiae TaxID=106649 RepID=UPI001AE7A066
MFSSIEHVKDRAFIPFQVRLEFENRRLNIISNNLNKYNKLKSILNDGKDSIYKSIADQQVYKDQIKFTQSKD